MFLRSPCSPNLTFPTFRRRLDRIVEDIPSLTAGNIPTTPKLNLEELCGGGWIWRCDLDGGFYRAHLRPVPEMHLEGADTPRTRDYRLKLDNNLIHPAAQEEGGRRAVGRDGRLGLSVGSAFHRHGQPFGREC